MKGPPTGPPAANGLDHDPQELGIRGAGLGLLGQAGLGGSPIAADALEVEERIVGVNLLEEGGQVGFVALCRAGRHGTSAQQTCQAGGKNVATANHSEQVQVALYHSWKLIRYPRVNRTQLFDLKKDPFERNDLVGKKKSAERVQELSARLDQALQRYGDKLYSPD